MHYTTYLDHIHRHYLPPMLLQTPQCIPLLTLCIIIIIIIIYNS